MQEIMKDFVNQLVGIANSYGMFGYKDTGKVSLVRKCSQCLNILYRDGMFVNHSSPTNNTLVHGDVAVYQFPFLQGGEVIDDDTRTSGRNEYLYAFGFGGFQRFDGGNGNLVGLEAHQCTVDVKKTGL